MLRWLAPFLATTLAAALAGCTHGGDTDSDTDPLVLPTGFQVAYHTDPSPPVAEQPATMELQVTDDGQPADDLQPTHTRMIHTFLISKDLEWFGHLHQEDYEPVTADDLRNATFHYPVTFPYSGDYKLSFDYAAENVYHNSQGWQSVDGNVPQLDAPVIDTATSERDVGDVHVKVTWDVPAVANYESAWHVTITDADGNDVTDVVQWLGADSHVALASTDLSYVGHSHAYIPGMENAPPDHEMPHVYSGPDIPYHYTFIQPGTYKMWVQFARSANPDVPYTVPFMFEVAAQ